MTTKPLIVALTIAAATLFVSAAERQAPRDAAEHSHHAAGQANAGAVARIEPLGQNALRGTAEFHQSEGEVVLEVRVSGATPGPHAMHIHEFGNCGAADGSTAGQHWNPEGHEHGEHAHAGRAAAHRGDIGNIEVGPDGTGRFVLRTRDWTVGGPDATNVLGKSVIVHAGTDDFTTQPGGKSGDRVACGVIAPQK